MPNTIRTVALLATAALALTGCRADPKNTDFDSITSNLNPELRTISERDSDVDVNLALNEEQQMRAAWNDLGRFWLLDRPSKLSPFPIMSTTGNP